MMKLRVIPSGPFVVNTILISDGNEALLVDPGDRRAVEEAREIAEREDLKLKFILNTHEHPDHTAANSWAKLNFPEAELIMHPKAAESLNFWTESEIGQMAGAEYSPPPDRLINEGDTVKIGNAEFKVLHTPGHSPGSVVLYSPKEKVAVVGDLIFRGSIGRYDLPQSSYEELKRSILKVLNSLDPATLILPGHGETTSLKDEIEGNPFIRELIG
ncbi:MAG: MBL fold metallo-hydrolase [Desulfurobacteriaceae bacterium]